MKRKKIPCMLCAVALAAAAALAPAQEKSHDALALPREKAKAENQRVLLYLTKGKSAAGEALDRALGNYRALGKFVKYEYQLTALPAASLPGRALHSKLALGELRLPALVVLDTKDKVLGTLSAAQMVDEGPVVDRVKKFLEEYKCEPVHARKTIANALTVAKKTKRQVFVYLSAPW